VHLSWASPFALVVLLWACALSAAPPKLGLDPAAAPSLAGQLLIASPRIKDPRFQRTVILMVRHDQGGALGITVNRPIDERSLASLLASMGDKGAAVEGDVKVFAGGPVHPQLGFVIHSPEYKSAGTVVINERFAMTQNREILRDIGEKRGPDKVLVAFGYAGWAAGQLEGELGRNDWLVAPADTQLVFDEVRDRVWEAAMARRPRDL
jgi:putative transcriptional regulator